MSVSAWQLVNVAVQDVHPGDVIPSGEQLVTVLSVGRVRSGACLALSCGAHLVIEPDTRYTVYRPVPS